ncbi:hypothetical protein T492DRAFT_1059010 [Pavlovales sp. CCMP2436]|nr:hypothetical protein T492DRAFT_1059010 [Pavlovales sp. CCMP2436]|mmetsp:Transcript_25552/g.64931  ORF Transcript_25552/g.64931 Transcript_25552/m.64931 type:complete len:162 (+) Transcript_25552:235-720(+)|eukprot:CAMPEP_0180018448 /NCGR_PEP_ID=MMETSP0984-20121128/20489_1 /TAXON_ID=483367 /ORGANISM="non described non described, Strain CCMP 2436" /LENGTH=161 /DNA_ID=CAMNT_0021941737 /DNA_START=201 /DNA_END=686 /DNA_ORIENTATION=+
MDESKVSVEGMPAQPRHAIPLFVGFVLWNVCGLAYGLLLFAHRKDGSWGTTFDTDHLVALVMAIFGCMLSTVQTLRSLRAIRHDDAGTIKWTPRLLTFHTVNFTVTSIVLITRTYQGYRPVAIASAIHIVVQLPFAASVIVNLWRYRAYLLAKAEVKAAAV